MICPRMWRTRTNPDRIQSRDWSTKLTRCTKRYLFRAPNLYADFRNQIKTKEKTIDVMKDDQKKSFVPIAVHTEWKHQLEKTEVRFSLFFMSCLNSALVSFSPSPHPTISIHNANSTN